MFNELAAFVLSMLSLPLSNAVVERVFNIKINCYIYIVLPVRDFFS